MKSNLPTYLYQYSNSANYFFRTRLKNSEKFDYYPSKGAYFVASLQTSCLEDSRWLALYIKRNLMEDQLMEEIDQNVKAKHDVGAKYCDELNIEAIESTATLSTFHKKAIFKRALREKFALLLSAGKKIIEFSGDSPLDSFTPFSASQREAIIANPSEIISPEQQQASLKWISENTADTLTGEGDQYIQYVTMLDSLMTQLNEYRNRLDAYEVEPSPRVSYTNDLFNFNIAFAQHQTIKAKIDEAQRLAPNEAADFYSLGNQLDMFLLEQSRKVKAETINDYRSRFKLLFETIPGDFDCRAFGKMQVQEVKNMLLVRPANITKGCDKKSLNAKTINGYLSNYRTFFSWLIKNIEGIEKNPFADVSVKDNELSRINRRPFTPDEVTKLLDYTPQHASEAKIFRDDANWFVPITFYTGMRLNEVSEIQLDDIKQEQGVWCFDLRSQNVKNVSSRRLVPIAQYLLDIGLLEYVHRLKRAKKTYLFSQIRKGKKGPGKAGWGDPISRWFNRSVLKNIGIDVKTEERNKTNVVFHCIRHTVISTCVKRGAQKHLVKRIVGHAQDDQVTLGVYSDVQDISLALLKKVLDDNLTWHLDEKA